MTSIVFKENPHSKPYNYNFVKKEKPTLILKTQKIYFRYKH